MVEPWPRALVERVGVALDRLTDYPQSAVTVAVACSGGADSTALLFLTKIWAEQRGHRVIAFTVDHGLRQASALEAEEVQDLCRSHNIAHRTLVWSGVKPESGLQARARLARYDLLDQAAFEEKAPYIAIGHTLDDQVETVVMRLRRGSGPDGLAGMPAKRPLAFSSIIRPLLNCRRFELQNAIKSRSMSWIDDPSNSDQAFERVRLRSWLSETLGGEAPGLIAASARELGIWRDQRLKAAAKWLGNHADISTFGSIVCAFKDLHDLDDQAQIDVLKVMIASVGGGKYGPRTSEVSRLNSDIQESRSATLGHVLFDINAENTMTVRREDRHFTNVDAGDKASLVWDNRFAFVFNKLLSNGFYIGALGQKGVRELSDEHFQKQKPSIKRQFWPAMPALFDPLGVCEVPHLGYRRPGVSQSYIHQVRWIGNKAITGAGFVVA